MNDVSIVGIMIIEPNIQIPNQKSCNQVAWINQLETKRPYLPILFVDINRIWAHVGIKSLLLWPSQLIEPLRVGHLALSPDDLQDSVIALHVDSDRHIDIYVGAAYAQLDPAIVVATDNRLIATNICLLTGVTTTLGWAAAVWCTGGALIDLSDWVVTLARTSRGGRWSAVTPSDL
jgi:hypothetical protein